MQLTVRLIHETDQRLWQRLDLLYAQNELILTNQEALMAAVSELDAKLDTILADVNDESTKIDSFSELVRQLKEQIAGLIQGNIPADVMAKVNAVFDGLEKNKQKAVDALNSNGGTPTPTPAPVPNP